jgi:alginate O-acetyltransferase complex protein AlgF
MTFLYLRRFSTWIVGSTLLASSFSGIAQPAGMLYDPEPPADSAYVRVVHTGPGAVDVSVDGRVRTKKLSAGEPSEYLVLSAGKHAVALHPAGKSEPTTMATVDVVSGRAKTVAFTGLKSDVAPVLFEDKANSNKLKSLLTAYHLDPKVGPLDVFTADGVTKVFTGLVYGGSASIQVNPISIDLIAVKSGDKVAQTKISLTMSQGGTYSFFMLPGPNGKLVSRAAQNKNERFTGK